MKNIKKFILSIICCHRTNVWPKICGFQIIYIEIKNYIFAPFDLLYSEPREHVPIAKDLGWILTHLTCYMWELGDKLDKAMGSHGVYLKLLPPIPCKRIQTWVGWGSIKLSTLNAICGHVRCPPIMRLKLNKVLGLQ